MDSIYNSLCKLVSSMTFRNKKNENDIKKQDEYNKMYFRKPAAYKNVNASQISK